MEPGIWTLLGLAFGTLISEDAAVLSGGILAADHSSGWWNLFLACFLGVWLGDLGLFLLAWFFGKPFINLIFRDKAGIDAKLAKSSEWFQRYGAFALVGSRLLPGMRVITYLSAGLIRMSFSTFTLVTGLAAAAWVLLIFEIVQKMGKEAPEFFVLLRHHLALGAVVVFLLVALLKLLPMGVQALFKWAPLRKLGQWEFWPAWLFYFPVVLQYIRLALIHRSLTLPTAANPGMFTGGLIGESKFETLNELQQSSPEFVAKSFLLPSKALENRLKSLDVLIAEGSLAYPFIFKPDAGQRGSGFKIIASREVAVRYLENVTVPVIAQHYIPGPYEVGIFYYRFPTEAGGRIFAMTEKIFPFVTGDGIHTLEQLIRADARAAMIAGTYLQRFDEKRNTILPSGVDFRLVEAGNHIQGCLFADGMHLWSERLEERINMISQKINGFFIGRYDLRYSSPTALTSGTEFHILELNGAAAEATSAYDASKKLSDAYRLLFRQWELVFAIGAANRKLGHRPDSAQKILAAWKDYQRQSACHPQAD